MTLHRHLTSHSVTHPVNPTMSFNLCVLEKKVLQANRKINFIKYRQNVCAQTGVDRGNPPIQPPRLSGGLCVCVFEWVTPQQCSLHNCMHAQNVGMWRMCMCVCTCRAHKVHIPSKPAILGRASKLDIVLCTCVSDWTHPGPVRQCNTAGYVRGHILQLTLNSTGWHGLFQSLFLPALGTRLVVNQSKTGRLAHTHTHSQTLPHAKMTMGGG